MVSGNGLIDLDEFIGMMESRDRSSRRERCQDAEMRALFAAFDKDNSGYIDGHELKLTMRDVGMDLTNRDVEMMMRAAGVAIKDRIFYEGLALCWGTGGVTRWCNGKAFGFAICRTRIQILLKATLRNNLGQVVYTYVPLSSSSITWYRPKGSDALQLGR